MKRLVRRSLLVLLSMMMCISIFPKSLFANEVQSNTSLNNEQITIEGTNTLGTLLSEEIQESQEESALQMEGYKNGYAITDLSF